jgi:uncharacterized protein (TIGR02145 family)
MKQKNRIIIYPILVMGFVLILANSCKKDETTASKNNPIITWDNPLDITYGTLLSATQLNATADVPGIFVYTPAIGTKLNLGNNQDLIVDFTPNDTTSYYTVSKTVKINVTLPPNSVTDIDGNVYNTVTIGTQVWMAENLKTTHYSNGTAIALVNTNSTWDALTATSKAYCWYNDDIANKATYGALYTWAAAMNGAASVTANPSGIQGVCPTGWHLPSDAEWNQMENYLADNGHNYDGTTGGGDVKIAKSLASTSGWTSSSNTGAVGNTDYPNYRNKSGFTALPGDSRSISNFGAFDDVGSFGGWWSATELNFPNAYIHYMFSGDSHVSSGPNYKALGCSVRCVRD